MGAKNSKRSKGNICCIFNWCIDEKYLDKNPFTGFNKRIKSEKVTEEMHVPFTDTHMKMIMQRLDATDKFGALFGRFIYGTCMRPAELRGVQLKHINLDNKTLFIPLSIMKNTKAVKPEIIDLDDNLIRSCKK